MPDFLVSAATGALKPVLDKLADLLSDEYKRFKGVHGEVKSLIRELAAMHAFLLKKSEEENPDAQEEEWMKEVRELSYDIEDSLDEFRVRIDDESTKPDAFIDKCKKLFQLDKTKARRRIAKEIEKLKAQVKEVSERNVRYKICDTVMNTSKVTVDPRALAIFEDASRLVGIDKPKHKVVSFLTKEDGGISSQQPKIVSIVGIGGVGKTTLANQVYQELKDQFQCRAFISVSRNPDMAKILRNILSQVTGQRYCETEAGSIQQLIMEINHVLRTERYFIVIDDVWDMETWDTIKYALSNNSCGSVIITTTRIHNVAKACCSLYSGWVFQPKPLQEHDSKRLFYNRIFGLGNECPESLKEVSDKILKKCGGLPLAIIAISSLLANKARNGVHSVTEWDQVQISIGHGLERNNIVEGMMRILSISYFDLPHHLKACLLYLSIFPEDYSIEKKHLVRLWVAEGFIPAESTLTLYESGEKSFNELINRNLILPWEINQWTSEVDSCRVHDTILDFTVYKSTKDNFVTVHGIPRLTHPSHGIKVRRLSLQGKTEGDVTLHSNQICANVRSIICFGFPCSLVGLRYLRVLDFTGGSLENHHLANIGELLQLRYLGLRETSVTELPEQIGELQYLETLDIRGCYIIQLPTALVRLKRLVNLLIHPKRLKCFPSGIRNMQALEYLKSVLVDINAAAIFVEEIGDLTKMRHLDISFFSNSGIIDEESYVDLIKKMVSSFQQLNKLQTLDIGFHNYGEAGHAVIFNGDDVILEVPWCSSSLRMLVFNMIPMSRVPGWMKSLVNIEELELRIYTLDQESLCILGDLPVLVDLTVKIVNNNIEGIHSTDKQRLVVSNRHGYRSLRRVDICSWPPASIPMLTFEAGCMPKLERLYIDFDADITIYVSNGHLDFGLKHLSQLTEVCSHIFGVKLSIWRVETAIKKALDNHPELPWFMYHFSSPEGETSNREHLRPRRRSQSTLHTAQPKRPSIAADLSQQEVVQEPADDVVICTSGDDKMSSSTTDENTAQKRRRLEARQGATIRGRELVQAAILPERLKGTSGSDDKTSFSTANDSTGQSLTAALPLPTDLSFMHNHGASPGLGPRHGLKRRIRAPLIPDRVEGNTALPLPTDLSFTIHHHGASPDLGRRHGQQRRRSRARQGATIHGRELVKGLSGATPATADVLGPQFIAAPQQQGAFVLPCFTFSSGSPPNAEAERQAMDSYEPLQHDDPVNEFSSAFNSLSLRDDHPWSAATSDTGSSSCLDGRRQQQQ